MNISKKLQRSYPGAWPLLVMLVPAFFILHNLNEFYDLINIRSVWVFVPAWFLLPLVLYGIARWILKADIHLSVVASILVSLIFFFFGSLQDFFHTHHFVVLSKSYFLLGLCALLVFLIIWGCRSGHVHTGKFIRFSLTTLFILIVWELGSLGVKLLNPRSSYSSVASHFSSSLPAIPGSDGPDIYHIVFDGYASSGMLYKYWNYNNPIDSLLRSRRFHVDENSRSNYNFSPYSLASTFDLDYLNGAAPYLARNDKNFYIGRIALEKNSLFKLLKEKGYRIDTYSMIISDSVINEFGEAAPSPPLHWLRNQTLERIYLNIWVLEKFRTLFRKSGSLPSSYKRNLEAVATYNLGALQHLLQIARSSGTNTQSPLFSYTHFFMPHGPYVFDSLGKVHTDRPLMGMEGYLQQVKYCNTIADSLVRLLLADTARKKVIIIQGDHGYREFPVDPGDGYGNLNAIYFYQYRPGGQYDHISPVNTYRMVLNDFFNADLPLLKDSMVTEKIKSP